MAKKKRKRAKNTRRTGKSSAQLVAAFRSWRTLRGLDPDDAWIIEILLDLKRDYLGIADPRVWPDQETYELCTQVLPRKAVIEPEDQDRIAPTLGDFFTFLRQRGSWSPRSLPFEDVPDLIGELTTDMPDILADPGNRGMAGNLIQFAVSEGVDVSDEAAMADFIRRFNEMDDDERAAIIDAGSPAGTGASLPGAAFGLAPGSGYGLGSSAGHGVGSTAGSDQGHGRVGIEDRGRLSGAAALDDGPDDDDVGWPDFIGDPPDEAMLQTIAAESEEPGPIVDSVLMRRADEVLAFIGKGREVTESRALSAADTVELAARLGIEFDGHSIWDVPALGVLWSSLIVTGFIEIRESIAYPAAKHLRWAAPDDEGDARLLAGRMLQLAALDVIVGAPGEESEDASPEAYRALRHAALLKAATPGGLTLLNPADSSSDEIVDDLDLMLQILAEVGIVTEDDGTFYLAPPFLALLPDAVEETLSAGAERES